MIRLSALLLAVLVAIPGMDLRAERLADADEPLHDTTVQRAVAYLESRGQSADGSFSASAGPGVTALATTALLRSGRGVDTPAVARGLQYLLQFVHEDGGIYQDGTLYRNYETCLAMLCLGEANRDGRYDAVLQRADAFVRGLQWDEGEEVDASDFRYGGAGYGNHKRPDLSNTAFFVEALKSMGPSPHDPAIERALVFISRCQNLESAHNMTPFSAKNPDGGFYYTPAAGGTSQAGTTETGGLRSYGSMTYAGLKSMIFAGVGPEDPRVQAAVGWIREHYGLDSNPGIGSAGLYYYYHTFAKALHAMGATEFADAQGTLHDWRAELVAELARRQQPDGSWINDNQRWLEGDPNLVTSYALLALSYCRPTSEETGGKAG
ncbi:MAG: terpene cyclase/mutase family protein [Pirellulaceae bacterium]|jgi:squalene-hopene/tetraprenyl-beta-curcumene cyclase|nr:terpene cyclase/mutase family protein [Pirellulaceae bacterium]